MKKKFLVGLVMGLLVLGIAERASANLVSNGSFELGTFANEFPDTGENGMVVGTGSPTVINDWNVVNNPIAWLENTHLGLATPYGSRFLDLTGIADSSLTHGGVSQTIDGIITNQEYRLSFDLGTGPDGNDFAPGEIQVKVTVGNLPSETFFLAGRAGWNPFSLDFVGAGDANLTFEFLGTVGFKYIGLDNVSITAVPLPASVWLFMSGLGALFIRFRKKPA